MPSFQIHLAVAKRYIEKHEIKDEKAFMEGSVAPDFVRPKEKSHYTIEISEGGLLEKLKTKVDIEHFLRENEIKTDYDRGVLLHLLTDKIFFTEFFDEEWIKATNGHDFTRDLYTSYTNTNDYLQEKYQIIISKELADKIKNDIEKSDKEKKIFHEEGNQIIAKDKLDAFIERVSDINLEEYV